MTVKKIICIECPKGCIISAEIRSGKLFSISGNECQKGEAYAFKEIENPVRILTSVVLAEGLSLKMVPVKTDRAVPKADIMKLMEGIKKIRLRTPVKTGDVIEKDFMGSGADLIATRDCPLQA